MGRHAGLPEVWDYLSFQAAVPGDRGAEIKAGIPARQGVRRGVGEGPESTLSRPQVRAPNVRFLTTSGLLRLANLAVPPH